MKNYQQLTAIQQVKAIEFAKKELVEALSLGTIVVGAKLSESEIEGLATVAAEESQYDSQGNALVEGMDVPYHFLGGCV